MRRPLVFSWSGGKDSAMALHALLQHSDFEVVALLTTVTAGFDRISMHGVRRELLHQQAESIGLPVEEVAIPSQCPNSIYESRMAETLVRLRERGVQHFGFGDIFLRDLRTYREKNLEKIGAEAIFPLWDLDTRGLAARFVNDGFRAITVCVDPRKLDKTFGGRELNSTFFEQLPADVDPCGENGEFHTFVFDGPIFRSPILVETGEIVERDSFVFCDVLPIRKEEHHAS
jgi:uncharacterized protein (TIGR00290 family)